MNPSPDLQLRFIPHCATVCMNNNNLEKDDEGSLVCGEGGDESFDIFEEACAQPDTLVVSAVSFHPDTFDCYSTFHSQLTGMFDNVRKKWYPIKKDDGDNAREEVMKALGVVYATTCIEGAYVQLLDMEDPDLSWSSLRRLYAQLCSEGPATTKRRDVWVMHLRAAIEDHKWCMAHRMHLLSRKHFPGALEDVLLHSSGVAKAMMDRKLRVTKAWEVARKAAKAKTATQLQSTRS